MAIEIREVELKTEVRMFQLLENERKPRQLDFPKGTKLAGFKTGKTYELNIDVDGTVYGGNFPALYFKTGPVLATIENHTVPSVP